MNYLFKNILFASQIETVHKTNYQKNYDHLEFHPHYELYFCPKKTEQILTLNGKAFKITKPCIILTKPYTVHLMQAEKFLPEFERYVIYFSDRIFSCPSWLFNKNLLSRTAIFESNSISELSGTVKKIFDKNNPENYRFSCLIEIFTFLSNLSPDYAEEKDNIVSPILEYIHNNVSENLNGDILAKEFHMSRATLDRLFQKYVGQPLHKTIIDFKLNNAISLLKYTNKSILEISLLSGFENDVYFYSFFKKHTGLSPSKFRKAYSTDL